MKKSELTFAEGFTTNRGQGSKLFKAFDWDKAALKIKELLVDNPNLRAEAGLQGDWDYTGGVIFENNKHTSDNYTYLKSNWAIPTLLVYNDEGDEILEMECFTSEEGHRFNSESTWDNESIALLK